MSITVKLTLLLTIFFTFVCCDFLTGSSSFESCTQDGETSGEPLECTNRLAITFTLGNSDTTGRYEISSAQAGSGEEVTFEPYVIECEKKKTRISFNFTSLRDNRFNYNVLEKSWKNWTTDGCEPDANGCIGGQNAYNICPLDSIRVNEPGSVSGKKCFCQAPADQAGMAYMYDMASPVLRWQLQCKLTIPYDEGDTLPTVVSATSSEWTTDVENRRATTAFEITESTTAAAAGNLFRLRLIGIVSPPEIPLANRVGDFVLVPRTGNPTYVAQPLDFAVLATATEVSTTGLDCGRFGTNPTGHLQSGSFCNSPPTTCLPKSMSVVIDNDLAAIKMGGKPSYLFKYMMGLDVPFSSAFSDQSLSVFAAEFTPDLAHSLQLGLQIEGSTLKTVTTLCGGTFGAYTTDGYIDTTSKSSLTLTVPVISACAAGNTANYDVRASGGECVYLATTETTMAVSGGLSSNAVFRVQSNCMIDEGKKVGSTVTLTLHRNYDQKVLAVIEVPVIILADFESGEGGSNNEQEDKGDGYSCGVFDVTCCFASGGFNLVSLLKFGCWISSALTGLTYLIIVLIGLIVVKKVLIRLLKSRDNRSFSPKSSMNQSAAFDPSASFAMNSSATFYENSRLGNSSRLVPPSPACDVRHRASSVLLDSLPPAELAPSSPCASVLNRSISVSNSRSMVRTAVTAPLFNRRLAAPAAPVPAAAPAKPPASKHEPTPGYMHLTMNSKHHGERQIAVRGLMYACDDDSVLFMPEYHDQKQMPPVLAAARKLSGKEKRALGAQRRNGYIEIN